jgi:hypothetical protein
MSARGASTFLRFCVEWCGPVQVAASTGVGSNTHFATELFKHMTGGRRNAEQGPHLMGMRPCRRTYACGYGGHLPVFGGASIA